MPTTPETPKKIKRSVDKKDKLGTAVKNASKAKEKGKKVLDQGEKQLINKKPSGKENLPLFIAELEEKFLGPTDGKLNEVLADALGKENPVLKLYQISTSYEFFGDPLVIIFDLPRSYEGTIAGVKKGRPGVWGDGDTMAIYDLEGARIIPLPRYEGGKMKTSNSELKNINPSEEPEDQIPLEVALSDEELANFMLEQVEQRNLDILKNATTPEEAYDIARMMAPNLTDEVLHEMSDPFAEIAQMRVDNEPNEEREDELYNELKEILIDEFGSLENMPDEVKIDVEKLGETFS